MQHDARVEVTGQLAGLGSLLLLRGSQKSHSGGKCFYLMNHLTDPILFFCKHKAKTFKGYLERDGLNTKACYS